MEQNLTKCPNDTRCMDNTRTCFSETTCTIKLLADEYNPDLDRGVFRVVVSQGDTSAAQTVVVDANPQAVVMVTPFSVSMNKVWHRQWCLFHAYRGIPSFMTYHIANLCFVATQKYSAILLLPINISCMQKASHLVCQKAESFHCYLVCGQNSC